MLRYFLNIGSFFMPLDKKTSAYAEDLLKFMKEEFGFEKDPVITYIDDEENASKILGFTGHYDPQSANIAIYITGRHPKDILRSLAHELMHHVQSHEGINDAEKSAEASDPNYIMYNDHLKFIEADAFERGNIKFREWEAYHKGYKGSKKMNEKKERKFTDAQVTKQHDIAKGIAKSSGHNKPTKQDFKKAAGAVKAKMEESTELEESIEVNESLLNSLAYLPEERVCTEAYNAREEEVYNTLLQKFGIKKG